MAWPVKEDAGSFGARKKNLGGGFLGNYGWFLDITIWFTDQRHDQGVKAQSWPPRRQNCRRQQVSLCCNTFGDGLEAY